MKLTDKKHHGKLNSWGKPPRHTWPIHPFMLKWAPGYWARGQGRRCIFTVTVYARFCEWRRKCWSIRVCLTCPAEIKGFRCGAPERERMTLRCFNISWSVNNRRLVSAWWVHHQKGVCAWLSVFSACVIFFSLLRQRLCNRHDDHTLLWTSFSTPSNFQCWNCHKNFLSVLEQISSQSTLNSDGLRFASSLHYFCFRIILQWWNRTRCSVHLWP